MPPHRSYTVAFKLQVITWYREQGALNKKRTADHFHIDRKRLREWLEKEEELLLNRRGSASQKKRLGGGCQPMSPELDQIVLDFLLDERAAGRPVSNADLVAKARVAARGLDGVDPNFKASDGWLRRFKKRNHVGIRRGTNEAQKLPEDFAEVVSDFVQSVRGLRVRHDYSEYNMANMDQTMVRFDMQPNYTNNIIGARDIRIATSGGAKRGFTVALAARASGHKLPAYIVLKEPTGRIPQRVAQALIIPNNVRITCTQNGWMTAIKMRDWQERCWGPNTDDVRRLLILDQARIHTTQQTKDCLAEVDTDIVFIPGGCTSILQPADVSWNKPFKSAMRSEWKVWRRQDQRTPAGNLKVQS